MTQPSTSDERIIPIEIEDDDSNDVIPSTPESLNEDEVLANSSSPPPEVDLKRILPPFNTKEKLIIIVDRAKDDHFTNFKLKSTSMEPLAMVKRSIELFLYLKQMISKQHEYALVVLNENTATWVQNFTNNINKIITSLQEVTNCEAEDIFNLNTLFEEVTSNCKVPAGIAEDNVNIPPPFVVRCILFYGRSYTLPQLEMTDDIRALLESPYFTFDVLMTHEPEGIDNNCGKIFEVLESLDTKGFAYFFSVARNTKLLNNSVAKLVSHPLQRPVQELADFKIKDI